MARSMQNNTLIQKLEVFIKKYYQNQLLKGAILGVSLVVVAFFAFSFFEYFAHFSTVVRTSLFYVFIAICLVVVGWYILRPILGLININRKFGIREASTLIGSHFPEVKDKLLNTLQLQELAEQNSDPLLLGSIEQRISSLSPIPFTKAIPTYQNLKYAKYALLPALSLLLILIVSPGFQRSSERLVNFDEHYEIPAPFRFITQLGEENAIQNQNIRIPLELKGNQIPKDAYVHIGEQRYKMRQEKAGTFTYEVSNVQKDLKIYFEAGGFSSKMYEIDVASKPSILGYSALISYPKYLGLQNEKLRNLGEINIPQGTTISWAFDTRNVAKLTVNPAQSVELTPGKARFKKRFYKTQNVQVKTANTEVTEGDSMLFTVNVTPDAYPQIAVEKQKDSLSNKIFYFLGDVRDDHGFSKLQFHYRFKSSKNTANKNKTGSVPVSINPKLTAQNFLYYWNLDAINIQAEDEIEYYFSVWDNDGVNGAKATKTPLSTYKAPSLKEIKEQTEQKNEEIKTAISGAKSQAAEMQKEINSIEKMLVDKKNLDWNDKKKIQDLINQQRELEKKIQNTLQQNLEKNNKEEEFSQIDEDIKEKQKQLEKLMDEVLDEKTKALMDKIEKLLQENRKDELQKAMEEFKFSEKEMNKEMDRLLELFKELELEKKLSETINKLNDLAKEEKKLAEKAKDTKGKDEKLADEQEKIKKDFEEVKKDLDDIQKKNNELESPMKISKQQEKKENVSQKMDDAQQKQEKGKNKDAAQDMDDAAEEMKEMAEQMQKDMEEAMEEKQEEDYNNLRQILENLIQLSYDQEKLMGEFKENQRYSPKYVELRQMQRKIIDETKMVEDSLLALSKRNIQIQSFVNTEVARVNENLDKALKYLGDRYTSNAIERQQYAMTGYNNLALMLSETLKQMQAQMKAQKENKGKPKDQCKKPGGAKGGKQKKPNANSIKKMQDELAKQMKELQEGQKQGKGKPGSKKFAQMAAKQAAIRKKIQELDNQLKKEGKGGSLGNLKQTQDLMDDIEEDLYNKRLNSETFKKLNQLEIKLSEHEKAEREQEQDQKRTSSEGTDTDQERALPPSIQKYLEKKKQETELLKQVSPELQPYYEKKVKQYYAD